MGIRTGRLKTRRAILLASTVLAATVPFSAAYAADQEAPVVIVAPDEVPGWYSYGGLEAGGRAVFQRPPDGFGRASPPANWLTARTTDSRAKFEEYGQVPSGGFLDWLNLYGGSNDGRYAYDFWARSVGQNNQSYYLDLSKVGELYLSGGWDQIPHLLSTSAKTVFGGVGSTFLTVDPALRTVLQANQPNAAANSPAGAIARQNIENAINNAEGGLTLGTQRDRGTGALKWTPTPDTELSVDYSNEHRTGTRPTGVPYGWGTTPSTRPTNPIEVPLPIDDTTQNVNGKAEYVGTTFWGTRWNTNVRYSGSFYHNDLKELDFQNPFCITCNVLTGVSALPPTTSSFGPNFLRLGLPPDNDSNAVTWTAAVDLPFFRSRYVSTLQYNDMRQNDPFINTGTNGLVAPPVTTQAGTPVTSLDGRVDTLLWNSLYNAQLTNDLKLTVRGRHYDVNNDTPSLHINNWIFGDSGCAAGAPNPLTGVCPNTMQRNSLPISYVKDNAGAELSWHPLRWATIGGGWSWERWDRELRDVDVTNENAGKVFVDLTPVEYIHARASYLFAERRYDTYDTRKFIEEVGIQFSEVASNMQRFDVANRNRQKVEAALDWTPGRFITITPNFGMRWDDYPDGAVFNPLGVGFDHGWNAGVELATFVDPAVKLLFSYNYESRRLNVAGGSGGANFNTGNVLTGCSTNTTINPEAIIGTACTWSSDIDQRFHTFMAAADVKVIPQTFDVRFEYLYVISSEANATTPCSAPNFVGATAVGTNCNGLQSIGTTLADPASVNFGQFPTERNNFQRFNVIGKYYVDEGIVRQMGWAGEVVLKLRYTWERNQNTNWAIDNMTPYIPTGDTNELTGGSRSLFLAAFNPNYAAQLLAMSVALKW
jgi:MtrB/PioB family decaheme-associated outer membrane protein